MEEKPLVYDDTTEYFYAFVRRDIPFVYQMIQLTHAAFETGRFLLERKKDVPPTNLCLFEVENEKELIGVSRRLKTAGVMHHMFFESDYNTGYSSLVTEPIAGQSREIMRDYRRYIEPPTLSAESRVPLSVERSVPFQMD